MPPSTQKTPTVYGRVTILNACEEARKKVIEDIGDSVFKDAADLACKLYLKHLKEVLFK